MDKKKGQLKVSKNNLTAKEVYLLLEGKKCLRDNQDGDVTYHYLYCVCGSCATGNTTVKYRFLSNHIFVIIFNVKTTKAPDLSYAQGSGALSLNLEFI